MKCYFCNHEIYNNAVEKHVIDYDIGFTTIQAHYECWSREVEKIKEVKK